MSATRVLYLVRLRIEGKTLALAGPFTSHQVARQHAQAIVTAERQRLPGQLLSQPNDTWTLLTTGHPMRVVSVETIVRDGPDG